MNIYPSLISANLLELGQVINSCSPFCDGFHIDIMDNHFVPNLTWGLGFVQAFIHATALPLFVHCMVDDPVDWAQKIIIRPCDYFIFHYEALSSDVDFEKICAFAKKRRFRIGCALNPTTPVNVVTPFIDRLDHILLMTVNPGFSGQKCIEKAFEKIDQLHALGISPQIISVDGGIKESHLSFLKNKNINGAAMASALFSVPNPFHELKKISSIAKNNF